MSFFDSPVTGQNLVPEVSVVIITGAKSYHAAVTRPESLNAWKYTVKKFAGHVNLCRNV